MFSPPLAARMEKERENDPFFDPLLRHLAVGFQLIKP